MANKQDVWQGTLALTILTTLKMMGPQHRYGIAKRIEQISANLLLVNYGPLYPALPKLEQDRRAKLYQLTRAGVQRLKRAANEWERKSEILARFLSPGEASS